MFVKDQYGNYSNASHLTGAWAEETNPGTWVIKCSMQGSETVVQLAGTWTSDTACREAIRELFDGVDPATYGD